MKIYTSFNEWASAAIVACKEMGRAIYLCANVFASAIASPIYFVWSKIRDFSVREPIAFAIIFILFAAMSYGWLGTYMNMKRQIVSAQHKVDSISYKTSIRMAR